MRLRALNLTAQQGRRYALHSRAALKQATKPASLSEVSMASIH
jgi:hypothetical protein